MKEIVEELNLKELNPNKINNVPSFFIWGEVVWIIGIVVWILEIVFWILGI